MNKDRKCVIVDNTVVTGICTHVSNGGKMFKDTDGKMVTLTPVPDAQLTISGTLSTINFITANWSRMIWQSVAGRAVRLLALGPFGTHFISGRVTVG
ncbi:hypothetical protein KIN20_034151 [Parelaphostrongylus tenuis]|uniref:Uncharacterized protein n=1 Tax=Parelaphostrongylus tenuis TaxID=148309 RepID=A0AAD5R9E0_PARTN|nr:hypothetical protein KIN20_034151 [Parelaphostrongylus tenuis]